VWHKLGAPAQHCIAVSIAGKSRQAFSLLCPAKSLIFSYCEGLYAQQVSNYDNLTAAELRYEL
jgi:hypothetical protein